MIQVTSDPVRPVFRSLTRGLLRRCPACGIGPSFRGYVKVADHCDHCGEPLGHIRADDMPPYVTIMLVGHIVVPLVLLLEKTAPPPLWIHLAVWPALTLLMTLLCLPRIKGAIVNLIWALRLRGDET